MKNIIMLGVTSQIFTCLTYYVSGKNIIQKTLDNSCEQRLMFLVSLFKQKVFHTIKYNEHQVYLIK